MASENPTLMGTIHTYSKMPRSLVNKEGLPTKGTKSSTTSVLSKRYQSIHLVTVNLPSQWIPDSVIIDGMFNIYSTPPLHHKHLSEYAQFLLKRSVLPHFQSGAIEVHFLFDDPDRYPMSPKTIERQR